MPIAPLCSGQKEARRAKSRIRPGPSFGALLSLLLPRARTDGVCVCVSHLFPKVVLSSSRTLFSFTCSSFRESLASGSSCQERKVEQGNRGPDSLRPGRGCGAGGPAPCQEQAGVALGPVAAKSGEAGEPSPGCPATLGHCLEKELRQGWGVCVKGSVRLKDAPFPTLKRAMPPPQLSAPPSPTLTGAPCLSE